MYIGIDIGGTKTRGGLLNAKFKVLNVVERPTQAKKNKVAVLDNIYDVIDELDNSKVKGIGIASRGLVDNRTGTVKEADKMPDNFRNVKLCSLVSKKFNKPTCVDNDANCFTLAEGLFGAGKGYESVAGVTLGTGIGGGLLVNEKLYRGAIGGAAEFGKTIIDTKWFQTSRGKWGRFEDLASGTGMDLLYKLKTGKKVGAKEVESKLYAGNKNAKEVFDEMSHYLAIGLVNIMLSMNPSVIIMGGGVGKVRALVEPAKRLIQKYVGYKSLIVPIKYAKLGPHAGLIGAALLCKERK